MACRRETIKTENPGASYRGIWPGLGRIYSITVETAHTTIIARPGEDLQQRVRQRQEKFARKGISISASGEEFDGRHKPGLDSVIL
jgi:hypothetical protein